MLIRVLDGVLGGRRGGEGERRLRDRGRAFGPAITEPGAWNGPPGLRRAICLSVECSALDEWA